MNTRLIIDKAGRVVIPEPLRQELRLQPGDALEIENTGEQITRRPVRETGPLTKEHGVWVCRTGQPLPASATDDMLRQIREERDLAKLTSASANEWVFRYLSPGAGVLWRSRAPSVKLGAVYSV